MSDELKQRFEDLIAYINKANEDVLSDKVGELTELDKDVTALCRDVESAEPELARDIQPLMAEMISKLDELAQSLTEFQQRQEENG